MNIVERNRKAMIWAAGLTLATLVVAIAIYYMLINEYPSLVWFITVNGVTGSVFYYDKSVSKLNDPGRRIPELSLLWMCLIGGSVGGIIVMLGRRHKTIDPQFRFILGIIVGIQIGALLFALWSWLTAASA